ncbi:hypothetical protein GBF38_002508, partial [Nibea albiflora]
LAVWFSAFASASQDDTQSCSLDAANFTAVVQGYDFGFLRKSRLHEECSQQNNYRWSTQYVGGNKLAVCNKESVQVAGAKSAYFPKDQDCRTTKTSSQLQNSTLEVFINELKTNGVTGVAQYVCLVCG